jgi:ABC-type tungstate transport system substrate-binding protein
MTPPRTRRSLFGLTSRLLAGGLLLFVLLPLATLLAAAAPTALVAALTDPQVLASLSLTLRAAAAATLLAALGGIPLAYLLARRRFTGQRLVEALVDLPVVVPHTAAGIALLLVFGRRGLLGEPLAALGLTFTDNALGVTLAMLFVSLPYLVNGSRAAFALIDPELELTALVEGASEWQAFRRVRGGGDYGVPSQDHAGAGVRALRGLRAGGGAAPGGPADRGDAAGLSGAAPAAPAGGGLATAETGRPVLRAVTVKVMTSPGRAFSAEALT